MNHLTRAVAAAVAITLAAGSAQAQGVRFGVAGTGLFSLDTGGGSAWGGTVLAGFGAKASSPLSFRVDASVVHGVGETDIFGTGDIVYTFRSAPSSTLHPYLLAGGGVYHFGAVAEFTGETKPMAKLGAGFDYQMKSVTLFAEPAFVLVFAGNGAGTFKFLQANVGVKLGH